MQIVIHCGGLPFNGETIPNGESLGGSESAAYYMAKELAALGHKVICFTNSQKMGKVNNVNYQYVGKVDQQNPMGENFHTVLRVPHDVVVAQRNPMSFIRPLNSKLNIWWLHDLALIRQGMVANHHLPFIDHVFTVSEFHKEQVAKQWDLPKDIITATRNGADYAAFPGTPPLKDRQPKSLVFAARPERGLEEIIRPKTGLAELMPDYHFHICTYKSIAEHMQGFYQYCWQRCDELPNVTNHGFLGKQALAELMGRCTLYVYPTSFEDTSNLMILEANGVGTPFVGLANHAALQETGKGAGCYWIEAATEYQYGIKDKSNLKDIDIEGFKTGIDYLCSNEQAWLDLHKRAVSKRQDWATVALEWEALFSKLLAAKCENKTRLYKHLEHYSDVYPIREDAKLQLQSDDRYGFMYSGDYKNHYDEYYRYEEKRGVKYGPEDLTGNPRFEQTAGIVDDLMQAFAVQNVPFKNVLDYGCAHGHYVMNLAKRFPKLHYTGIDINRKNIDIAAAWFEETQKTDVDLSVNFIRGDTESGFKLNTQRFELIICAEILEHVPNPAKLCGELKKFLTPNGYMLITVPYGAWEAIGYDDHPGWRAHIHQIERSDLDEIFGGQKGYRLHGLPHSEGLGHYFVTFENSDAPLGEVSLERKLKQQAPQQTVSACLIVKDGEHDLGRTLNSIKGIYDELIIGIDENTTDDTERVCQQYGANYFKMPSPLKIGFDEARNLTIKKAVMDWVLWIDCDETIENLDNLKKYLRPNCFDGYGIKQHHFAAEPLGVLKTDFPCRLFRNHKGMRFYGHVHEHPELGELNKGPGKVYVIPDVAIMHTGYATEAKRRKRFERNFPLMKIDHEKNPERILGQFLWMRDLAHLCKYTMEKNGMQVTEQITEWSKEGIAIFRRMLDAETPSPRLIVDGVLYYSQLVRLAQNSGGIEFAFDYASSKGEPIKDKIPIHGYFASKKDIFKLSKVLIKENIKYYNERYF